MPELANRHESPDELIFATVAACGFDSLFTAQFFAASSALTGHPRFDTHGSSD
jgi:hypothetical protein